MTATRVLICTTCRAADEALEPRGARAGARLFADLAACAPDSIAIEPVECLSVCSRPCTIGFSSPGKWTYVYGDFTAGSAAEILTAAELYRAAPDGLIPWKLRPSALKKGVVARIPPMAAAPSPLPQKDDSP